MNEITWHTGVTPLMFNIDIGPKNKPSQKESSLPTINFSRFFAVKLAVGEYPKKWEKIKEPLGGFYPQ